MTSDRSWMNLLAVGERIIPNIALDWLYGRTFLFAGFSYLA